MLSSLLVVEPPKFRKTIWLVVEPIPLKNMLVKMGSSSPNKDEHKKYLKPPGSNPFPSLYLTKQKLPHRSKLEVNHWTCDGGNACNLKLKKGGPNRREEVFLKARDWMMKWAMIKSRKWHYTVWSIGILIMAKEIIPKYNSVVSSPIYNPIDRGFDHSNSSHGGCYTSKVDQYFFLFWRLEQESRINMHKNGFLKW